LTALFLYEPTAAPAQQSGDESIPRWQINVDVAGVLLHPSATVDIAGISVPGSSASTSDAVTGTIDLSYFLTPHIAVDLYTGIPPEMTVKGSGSIAPVGTVGTTRYGAGALSIEYHFTGLGRVEPYVGAGVSYTAFFATNGVAVSGMKLTNGWGAALTVGFRYALDPSWGLHAYVRQLFVGTRLTGQLGPLPVRAKATLDPTIVGVGVSYRF
jgi:outer membrane protein